MIELEERKIPIEELEYKIDKLIERKIELANKGININNYLILLRNNVQYLIKREEELKNKYNNNESNIKIELIKVRQSYNLLIEGLNKMIEYLCI